MSEEIITDADRYPTLTDAGRRMLDFLREHPAAPIYHNLSGNRLKADEVEWVRGFERELRDTAIEWHRPGGAPWLDEFIAHCRRDVPFYRAYGNEIQRGPLTDFPTVSRADLSRDIAQFVPDTVPIERLINFRTSGTTGHPLILASHPVVAASYLAFHRRALRRWGVELRARRGEVGVVLLGFQRKCFTYVSVTPTLDEAGLAKINLHPCDWRDPADRAKYLEALAAEVIAGDPLSFAELLALDVSLRPRAILSTSMALLPALRQKLETRFNCPVLDLYSMNEAGPLAVADPSRGGHVWLQPRMLVEILDAAGRPLPEGQRGEVTLTGGFNFCLPLLRYRTGDQAALKTVEGDVVLIGLEGRPPVRFRTPSGEWLNNNEITHALRPLVIPQFRLHQERDGNLQLQLARGADNPELVRSALRKLFGPEQTIEIASNVVFDGKVIQYTSALESSAS